MSQLAFKDFSGGITDRDIPGTTNRYSIADNLLIQTDAKIYQRPGFNIYSSTAYKFLAGERVAHLVSFDASSELLGVQNKTVQYLNAGAWAEKTGPGGNHAFNTNTVNSLISEGQWNHHLYLASDSGDPVVKLYRDSGGTMQMRTAGLPKPTTSSVYVDDAAKLTAAIALAVEIKTKLKDHVDDFGADPAAHPVQDTAVSTALGALSTPTDLATLIVYTKALRTQYNAHLTDARLSLANQVYHIQESNRNDILSGRIRDPIINLLANDKLPADSVLDTLAEVVRVLNDLRNRYNWHAAAPITHNNADLDSPTWGAHYITLAALELDQKYPLASNQYAPLIRFVNYMKSAFNAHLANDFNDSYGFGHRTDDTRNLIICDDATDLQTSVTMLGLFEYHYAEHFKDANQKSSGNYFGPTEDYPVITGDTVAGSPDIHLDGGSIGVGDHIIRWGSGIVSPYNWQSTLLFPATAKVASISGVTITMDQNALLTQSNISMAVHPGYLHWDLDRSTGARTSSSWASANFVDKVDLSLSDLDSIVDFALESLARFRAHNLSAFTAYTNTELQLAEIPLNPNYTYYKSDTLVGDHYRPHQQLDFPFWPVNSLGSEPNGGQGYFEAGLETASYNYKMFYRNDYTVGDASFTDLSEPSDTFNVLGVKSGASIIAGEEDVARDAITFTSVPVLANASNQNYDTANIKVEFYRTQNAGTVFYKTGSITNGTTTFSDTALDSILLNNEGLYTGGGVVGNGAPPAATFIHISDERAYYVVGNKVYQSLTSDPDSVPATFFDSFDEDVVGVSSTRSTIVVLTANTVSRLVGNFDDLGNGFLRHEGVSDKTGCISAPSIVKGDNGVFFAGKDGFYYTDGFQCYRIADVTDLYATFIASAAQKNAIKGAYHATEKRIYWVMRSGSASAPDQMWVFDVSFGIKLDGTPFTTFSGGFDGYLGFNPTALVEHSDTLHYADNDGYLFKADNTLFMDLKKDTGIAATLWEKRTILYNWKSCHGDYGTTDFRKYFQRVSFQCKQETNLSLQLISDADKGHIVDNLPILRSRKLLDWGDPKIDWTASVYTAKEGGVIDEFRRFKANGSLRSNFRSLGFQNAFCVIVNSTDMGTLTIANVAGNVYTATLTSLVGSRKWPLYSVDYKIKFGGVLYPVTVRTSDSVVRIDATGLAAPTAGVKSDWEMWGYPKNEKVNLIGFTVDYEILGQQQKAFLGTTSTDGGQNA